MRLRPSSWGRSTAVASSIVALLVGGVVMIIVGSAMLKKIVSFKG